MKKMLCIMTALSVFAAPAAYAEFYGSVGIGGVVAGEVSIPAETWDADMSFPIYSVAVGYELPMTYKMRAEVEYLNLRSDITIDHVSGNYRTDATMLNVLFPIPVPVVVPYVGGGIGFATTSLGAENYIRQGFKEGLAYQAILGAEIAVPVISTVGLEMRYIRTNNNVEGADVTSDTYALFLKARF